MLFLLKLLPSAGVFLSKNWKLVLAGLAVAAVMGNFWYIDSLQDSLAAQKARTQKIAGFWDECSRSNAINQESIGLLRRANKDLAKAVVVTESTLMDSLQEAQEREMRATTRLGDILETLEELQNENPTCAEISRIDLGAVCPLSTERLREHARTSTDQGD